MSWISVLRGSIALAAVLTLPGWFFLTFGEAWREWRGLQRWIVAIGLSIAFYPALFYWLRWTLPSWTMGPYKMSLLLAGFAATTGWRLRRQWRELFTFDTLEWLALAVFASSSYLLVTASPWLEMTAVNAIGLPLGNLIVWAGIVALPMASYLGFFEYIHGGARLARVFRWLMFGVLALAGAWGLAAFGLAGNWAFNFSGGPDAFRGSESAFRFFRGYTVFLVAFSEVATRGIRCGVCQRIELMVTHYG